MTPLHHAYLLRGWLLDKNPPQEISEAVEAIMAVLESSVAPDRIITGDPARIAIRIEQPELANAISEVESAKAEETATPEKPRRQSNMSAEARAAAAERMRAYQAKKKAEREAASHGKQPAPAHREPDQPQFQIRRATVSTTPALKEPEAKPKPLPPIDPERLITVHGGYAGKREDGTLTDDDWPDIRARLAGSEEVKAIASDYEVSEEDLDFFIASCRRREAKSPGEALASPSSLASGATQRRT